VFERFTERARQVVVLAQDEARALKHDYIGTEHLLLGLLREEEGIAARVLRDLGVTLDDVRERVLAIVGPGEGGTAGQIPFTPRAKQALELALRESLSLGHNYIGTEHILLGLMRADAGVAAQILGALEIDSERARAAVIRTLAGTAVGTASSGLTVRTWTEAEDIPHRRTTRRWYFAPPVLLVAGWLLFALALGAGILVGWAIWG